MESAFPSMFESYDPTTLPKGFSKTLTDESGHLYYEYDQPILKPAQDVRDYRIIRLPNGMEVCIVSDPEADQAAASIVVRTGSFHEPESIPGLAHLCEHLMFAGSTKYPGESEYEDYITSKNGCTNASTEDEYQTFSFEISARNFEGAFDRLAHTLAKPLFESSLVAREVHAINSEMEGYKQDDSWKTVGVIAATSRPGHPASRFTVGNKKTLLSEPKRKGINVREALVDFHNKRYSANLMRCCIIANVPLTALAELACRHLSIVPTKGVVPSIWPSDNIGPKQMLHEIVFRTIVDSNQLTIVFPLADQSEAWRCEAVMVVGWVLQREGTGSLCTYLKQKGWVNGMIAGEGEGNTRVFQKALQTLLMFLTSGYSSFDICFDLTSKGKQYHGDVVAATFSFIKLLKLSGAKCLERSFREYITVSNLDFKYSEPGDASDLTVSIATDLHESRPRKYVLSTASAQIWDVSSIQSVLDSLSHRAFYITRSCQDSGHELELTEKDVHFDTKFSSQPIKPVTLALCKTPQYIGSLRLPQANPLIPASSLSPLSESSVSESPTIVIDGPIRIWLARPEAFNIPKVHVWIDFRFRRSFATAKETVLKYLLLAVVDQMCADMSYQAAEASVSYFLTPQLRGFTLNITGYKSSLMRLLEGVLEAIRKPRIAPSDFSRIKDDLVRSMQNWNLASSDELAQDKLSWLMAEDYHSHQDRAEAASNIEAEEVLRFGSSIMNDVYFEAYAHGDVNLAFGHDLQAYLSLFKPSLYLHNGDAKLLMPLPETNALVQDQVKNPEDVNNAYLGAFYFGPTVDSKLRVQTMILEDILEQGFFNELRTQQQLGYNLQLERVSSGGLEWLMARVESEQAPDILEQAVEGFLTKSFGYIANMDKEQFDMHKQSVVDGLLETFKTSYEEAEYNWKQIEACDYRFKEYQSDAELAKAVTQLRIIDVFRTHMTPDGPLRAKIAVHMHSQRIQIDSRRLHEHLPNKETLLCFKKCLKGKPIMDKLLRRLVQQSSPDCFTARLRLVELLCEPPDVAEGVQIVTSAKEFRRGLKLAP